MIIDSMDLWHGALGSLFRRERGSTEEPVSCKEFNRGTNDTDIQGLRQH